jgi:hypothetical protein
LSCHALHEAHRAWWLYDASLELVGCSAGHSAFRIAFVDVAVTVIVKAVTEFRFWSFEVAAAARSPFSIEALFTAGIAFADISATGDDVALITEAASRCIVDSTVAIIVFAVTDFGLWLSRAITPLSVIAFLESGSAIDTGLREFAAIGCFVDEAVTVVIFAIAFFRFRVGRAAGCPRAVLASLGAIAAFRRTFLFQVLVGYAIAVVVYAVAGFRGRTGRPEPCCADLVSYEVAVRNQAGPLFFLFVAGFSAVAVEVFVDLAVAIVINRCVVVAYFGFGLALSPISGVVTGLSPEAGASFSHNTRLVGSWIALFTGATAL